MSRWFRWYAGTTEDGKFRMVARVTGVTVATVTGVWAALLEDASHPDHRGIVTKNEDYFAAVLDLDDPTMEAILSAMQDAGMLSIGAGAMTVTHWKERQYETDAKDSTNAERQRRYRAKRQENASQTERNGSNALLKRPESESESDTERLLAQSTKQEPARTEPEATKYEPKKYFDTNGKLEIRAKSSTDVDPIDRIVKRAEGFALDVEAARELIRKNKPKNPAGYAITVFANDLKSRVPIASIETCTKAMRGDSDAKKAVYEAMTR